MSDIASNNKTNVQTTVDRLKENLNEIVYLSDMWVQLTGDKNRFENTERDEEIQHKIKVNFERFAKLANDVECGGQLLKALYLELEQAIAKNSITKKVFNVNRITCESSVKNIERNVGRIHGVKSVKVLFNENEAHVEFYSGKTTEKAVIDEIVRLGFQAKVK